MHKDAVESTVYAMKYQNRRIYGQTFGKEMAEHFAYYLWERKITLLVPVPLHSGRKRKRGFNQAEIVAKVLSENTGIRMDTGVIRHPENLEVLPVPGYTQSGLPEKFSLPDVPTSSETSSVWTL